jgi:hypothetical protein
MSLRMPASTQARGACKHASPLFPPPVVAEAACPSPPPPCPLLPPSLPRFPSWLPILSKVPVPVAPLPLCSPPPSPARAQQPAPCEARQRPQPSWQCQCQNGTKSPRGLATVIRGYVRGRFTKIHGRPIGQPLIKMALGWVSSTSTPSAGPQGPPARPVAPSPHRPPGPEAPIPPRARSALPLGPEAPIPDRPGQGRPPGKVLVPVRSTAGPPIKARPRTRPPPQAHP